VTPKDNSRSRSSKFGGILKKNEHKMQSKKDMKDPDEEFFQMKQRKLTNEVTKANSKLDV
jgi:hypothetical protein